MKVLFASGCALRNYKPELVNRMTDFLTQTGMIEGTYEVCCKTEQEIEEDITLIDCCPGCSHEFEAFSNVHVVPLWKVLLNSEFPFPDYGGKVMTIHDACHTRNRNSTEMQDSARQLCRKMNIKLVEAEKTRDETPCCGGSTKDYETRRKMAMRRAAQLPARDVVVYCIGCTRSFNITDAHPHHLLDLLFEEETKGITVEK